MASATIHAELEPGWIFLLPPELMNIVFSYLSVLSGASLAMTCKVYHEQFGFILKRPEFKCPVNERESRIPLEQYIINPTTGFYQRTELLLRLESDKLTFCGKCNYLYPSNQFISDSGLRWHTRDGIHKHRRERLFYSWDSPASGEIVCEHRHICSWGAELGKVVQNMVILGKSYDDRLTLQLEDGLHHRYKEHRLSSPKDVQPIMVCPHVNVIDWIWCYAAPLTRRCDECFFTTGDYVAESTKEPGRAGSDLIWVVITRTLRDVKYLIRYIEDVEVLLS
jgi:hypothetical protein